jgi:hypothetical protein
MSALPPKADMDQSGCDVRFVPEADIGEISNQAGPVMSANGMVRPCSCPASDESGKGSPAVAPGVWSKLMDRQRRPKLRSNR